jgi:acetylornithine deacetylase/succinyl-diaminopimelate desuccinylase-like protein
MKSFTALALSASQSFEVKKLKRPLTLVATADEESTMNGAKLIADNGRKLGCDCQLLGHGVPGMDTAEASEIVKHLTAMTGKRSDSVAFGTEAPYFNSMQTDTIVIGPGSINQAHQPNEFLPIDQIDPTIQLLEGLIQKFCID